jgi:uncharacterized BrkB/YihY/UPF0761 family membrane protein
MALSRQRFFSFGLVLSIGLLLLVSLLFSAALAALIFKFVPEAPSRWRAVWIGAVVTACLFDIGKTLIGICLGEAGPMARPARWWRW